jgi:hypothetical protein
MESQDKTSGIVSVSADGLVYVMLRSTASLFRAVRPDVAVPVSVKVNDLFGIVIDISSYELPLRYFLARWT